MLKKWYVIPLVFVIVFATVGAKSVVHICLDPGSYAFTMAKNIKGQDEIVRMQVDNVGYVTEVKELRILDKGTSADANIALNACSLYLTRTMSGQLANIWALNPSTGQSLRQITFTKDLVEKDPVLSLTEAQLAFTEIGENSKIVRTQLDGSMRKEVADNAASPAWEYNGPITYTDLSTGRIWPWNVPGSWHTYLPDRSGIISQTGDVFTIWPTVGVSRPFATGIKSVAFGPYTPGKTSFAAVITSDGRLEFWELDFNWLPTGNKVSGPGLTGLNFVAWLTVNK